MIRVNVEPGQDPVVVMLYRDVLWVFSALVGFFGIEKAAFYPRFGMETAHVSTEFKARVWFIPVRVLLIAVRFMRDPEIRAVLKKRKQQSLTKES